MTSALSKTFDGQHPCALCKLVRQGRAEERKQGALVPLTRLELLPSVPTPTVGSGSEAARPASFPPSFLPALAPGFASGATSTPGLTRNPRAVPIHSWESWFPPAVREDRPAGLAIAGPEAPTPTRTARQSTGRLRVDSCRRSPGVS